MGLAGEAAQVKELTRALNFVSILGAREEEKNTPLAEASGTGRVRPFNSLNQALDITLYCCSPCAVT